MKIDITRLRKFKRDATEANDGVRAASERLRNARDDLSRAKMEAARYDDLHPARGSDMERVTDAEREVRQRVRDHERVVADLTVEHERRERLWLHASKLWTRVADFAAANGALPSDLRD